MKGWGETADTHKMLVKKEIKVLNKQYRNIVGVRVKEVVLEDKDKNMKDLACVCVCQTEDQEVANHMEA